MKWSLSWAHRAISRISNWFAVSLYSGEWWFDVDSIYQTLISFNTIFIFRRNFLYSTSNIYDLSLSSLPVAARDIFDGWFIRIECSSAEARRIRFWRENGNSPVYVSAFAGVDFAPFDRWQFQFIVHFSSWHDLWLSHLKTQFDCQFASRRSACTLKSQLERVSNNNSAR